MKIEVYVVTPDGQFGRSRHYNKGKSAVARAQFLQSVNKPAYCIAIRHKATNRTFYRFGIR